MFEELVEFFSHVIAREAIVGETYVMEGRLFCVCAGPRRESFV